MSVKIRNGSERNRIGYVRKDLVTVPSDPVHEISGRVRTDDGINTVVIRTRRVGVNTRYVCSRIIMLKPKIE